MYVYIMFYSCVLLFASFIFPSSRILPQVCLLNLKPSSQLFDIDITLLFSHSICNCLGSLSLLPFSSFGHFVTFPNFLIWIRIISSFVFSLSCFKINVLQAINFPLRLVSHRLSNVTVPILLHSKSFSAKNSLVLPKDYLEFFFLSHRLMRFKSPIFLLSRSNFTAWWSENMVCMILIWGNEFGPSLWPRRLSIFMTIPLYLRIKCILFMRIKFSYHQLIWIHWHSDCTFFLFWYWLKLN